VDQRRRQNDLLPHAFRELIQALIAVFDQAEQFEQLRASRCRRFRIQMVQAGDELEVLVRGQAFVERRRLRHVSEPPLDLERLCEYIEPADRRAALISPDEACEDFHRRRLAGAVRAKKAEDLARLDVEIEFGHGQLGPVVLGEAFGADHVCLSPNQ
jgi:hypothetical protein